MPRADTAPVTYTIADGVQCAHSAARGAVHDMHNQRPWSTGNPKSVRRDSGGAAQRSP